VLKSRLKSRSQHIPFFKRYDLQYLLDSVAIVAEELGFYLPWEQSLLREITYLVGVAEKVREQRSKERQ
jgi:hypothetical protein